jgi:DNA-binding winged helix-turn-helix (wHTH) protein/predicted ATPase/type II secretory pathway predicted ATPase ExeA
VIYTFGEYTLDTRRYELRRAGRLCAVEPQVFEVLAYLLEQRDRVVTKQELLDHVWGHRFVSEATLTSRLMSARKAIGDSGHDQRLIKTIHGRGYRFVWPAEESDDGARPRVAEVGAEDGHDSPQSDEFAAIERPSLPPPTAFAVPTDPHGAAHRLTVGRAAELGQLREWLDRALEGARQLVFITGEAGLGKTTLIETFMDGAPGDRFARVARGQCLEQRGEGEAYMPVLEALARLCREPGGDEVIAVLSERAPNWLVQMPGLVDAASYEALRRRVLGTTRERMLREMAEALEALTAERPLVLVLEDLHWSDYSTLDLLSLLAWRQEPARLLLIGTFRPGDASRQAHPLRAVVQELRVRGGCVELALSPLAEEEIGAYLEARFAGAALPAELARLVCARTEGNPLFMRSLIEAWIADGALERRDGRWEMRASVASLAASEPDSLLQLIDQQLYQFSPEDQETLEAASVVGVEFSTAAVAAALEQDEEGVERRCAVLARQGQFLRSAGTAEWPDGTVAARFEFVHQLYKEVLYRRLPPGRQKRLHARIGARLETGYGALAHERAPELAVHFVRGRDSERALRYLRLAARHALQRSAYQEAVAHLRSGLTLLGSQPDTPERGQLELDFQMALASALVPTAGWTAPEVQTAYARARELGDRMGDPRWLPDALYGLAATHEFRGQYHEAQALIEQRLRLLEETGDVRRRLQSHELLACSLYHQGAFARSLEHTDRGLALYDPTPDQAFEGPIVEGTGVACHAWAGQALWFLGYPDRAVTRIEEGMRLAEDLGIPWPLVGIRAVAAFVHQFRREADLVKRRAEESLALAREHGFRYWAAVAGILRGWAMNAQGFGEEGLDELGRGLSTYLEMDIKIDRPYFLALLAEARARLGRVDEGLEAATEALALVQGSRSFFYEAEIHRLRGALILQVGAPNAAEEAERCYRQALEVARRQRARSSELRVALSLARLWALRGDGAEGYRLLAGVHAAFDEGLDTPDLREAGALLAGLDARAAPAAGG